jgi:hypothetical protein
VEALNDSTQQHFRCSEVVASRKDNFLKFRALEVIWKCGYVLHVSEGHSCMKRVEALPGLNNLSTKPSRSPAYTVPLDGSLRSIKESGNEYWEDPDVAECRSESLSGSRVGVEWS